MHRPASGLYGWLGVVWCGDVVIVRGWVSGKAAAVRSWPTYDNTPRAAETVVHAKLVPQVVQPVPDPAR